MNEEPTPTEASQPTVEAGDNTDEMAVVAEEPAAAVLPKSSDIMEDVPPPLEDIKTSPSTIVEAKPEDVTPAVEDKVTKPAEQEGHCYW